ncbi:MAG: pyruvate decarboxylase [Planctomycetaceae bacterium]|nr:pyruvate decarboxylase [Planctomycetaceae bacterium]
MENWTVGRYLAARLQQIGLKHYFAVPGDYNLVLLDELIANPDLQMVGCCNELNAGYAADGYARATGGASAVVVTFSVGGLSALNAVAGAYAEDLPVIAISGGPNTNSESEYELLHHTIGKVDYGYQREIFSKVTADAVVIQHPADAPSQIDEAIEKALMLRKPVYIEVACNIANAPTSAPQARAFGQSPQSDPDSLAAAVEAAAEMLNGATKPVLVAGVKIGPYKARQAFAELADAAGYAVAAMPNAKGLFSEQHPSSMGTYWGAVSSPGCSEVVDSADCYLFAGGTFSDYTTVGHTILIDSKKLIEAKSDSVRLGGKNFSNVFLNDFLKALTPHLKQNPTSLTAYNRFRTEQKWPSPEGADVPLTTGQLFSRIQNLIDEKSALVAETGDSWFNGMALKLPEDCEFAIQMQYGSIGWSVGATLGYALGSPQRRVLAMIGDGSFQMTAQEVSTMIRSGVNPIIFLINNRGYTIEVEIHDGPYNYIKNWDYAGLVDVFNAEDGRGWSCRVGTEGELDEAITKAVAHDGVSLIELTIERDDCSRTLLEWGAHVARNNGRPARFISLDG